MARIDSAYDYYMANYGGQQTSRYDAHKKSDLRKVYNRMVKTNKEAPLFKIPDLEGAKKYAIDIKENAKSIQNVVASLSSSYGGFNNAFQKKIATSSNEDKVGVEYIGNGVEDNSVEEFEIDVRKLASPQVNTGQYLANDSLSFLPGSYSFDLNTMNSSYEFQFNVNTGETNQEVLKKLAKLINNSNLGIDAKLLENDKSASALSLTSHQTGLSKDEDYLFSIAPGADPASMNAMDTLKINQVTQEASNSDFTLNGTAHSSLSNTFTINNSFELTLKDATDDEPVKIGFKANTDAIADNIQTLLDAYNKILDTAKRYSTTNAAAVVDSKKSKFSPDEAEPTSNNSAAAGNKLLKEMSSLSRQRRANLEYIGLLVSDDGSLSINKDTLTEAVDPTRAQDTFDTLNQFKDDLSDRVDNAAIDPMRYVNKIIVAYKNPGHNFNTPYVTSIYSGLMMDYSV